MKGTSGIVESPQIYIYFFLEAITHDDPLINSMVNIIRKRGGELSAGVCLSLGFRV